jgi:hypothetical protein
MMALEEALREATPICSDLAQRGTPHYGRELVAAVMEAKPVSTIARLLVWLQRQPEMLRLHACKGDDDDDSDEDNADADVAAAYTTSSSSSSSSDAVSYGQLWLNSVIGKGTACKLDTSDKVAS